MSLIGWLYLFTGYSSVFKLSHNGQGLMWSDGGSEDPFSAKVKKWYLCKSWPFSLLSLCIYHGEGMEGRKSVSHCPGCKSCWWGSLMSYVSSLEGHKLKVNVCVSLFWRLLLRETNAPWPHMSPSICTKWTASNREVQNDYSPMNHSRLVVNTRV